MPSSVETHRRYLVESSITWTIVNLELRPEHSRRQEAEQAALDAIRGGLMVPDDEERFNVYVTALGSREKVGLRRPLELA